MSAYALCHGWVPSVYLTVLVFRNFKKLETYRLYNFGDRDDPCETPVRMFRRVESLLLFSQTCSDPPVRNEGTSLIMDHSWGRPWYTDFNNIQQGSTLDLPDLMSNILPFYVEQYSRKNISHAEKLTDTLTARQFG